MIRFFGKTLAKPFNSRIVKILLICRDLLELWACSIVKNADWPEIFANSHLSDQLAPESKPICPSTLEDQFVCFPNCDDPAKPPTYQAPQPQPAGIARATDSSSTPGDQNGEKREPMRAHADLGIRAKNWVVEVSCDSPVSGLDKRTSGASCVATAVTVRELAARFGMDLIDLESHLVDMELLALFPSQALFRDSILPLGRRDGRVQVAVSNPLNLNLSTN